MAADDPVTYNGKQMRRDRAESLEAAQRKTHYRLVARLFPRIRSGDETYPMVAPKSGLCSDCAAAQGQLHEPLCDWEQCPICFLQAASCDCEILTDSAVHT